jgi:hypothetical protein
LEVAEFLHLLLMPSSIPRHKFADGAGLYFKPAAAGFSENGRLAKLFSIPNSPSVTVDSPGGSVSDNLPVQLLWFSEIPIQYLDPLGRQS